MLAPRQSAQQSVNSVAASPVRPGPRYSSRIQYAVSDAADLDEDTRFLQEQARRYVAARPWERLAGQAIFMVLKVGSWYQACAQELDTNAGNHLLFLFPGLCDMRYLQRAGLAEPHPGTIMAELRDPDSSFQMADDGGWLPLDRFSGRLLALALAAIIDLNASPRLPDTEISGELALPGRVRGRYRAVLKPSQPDDDRVVPIVGRVREDLFEEGDGTITFMNLAWDKYRALAGRAQLRMPAPESFEDLGESIPVVVISDSVTRAWSVVDKLHAAEPMGLSFGQMEDRLAVILAGSKDIYWLTTLDEQGAAVRAWWQVGRDASLGAAALMVADTTPDPDRFDRWVPANVLAVFEFGRQRPA